MKLSIVFILLLLSGCSYGANYIESESETDPVQLQINNGDQEMSLRCLVSMAHYITHDPAVIAPNTVLTIDLHRGTASNTLYFKRPDTPLMAIENIFCGHDSNWAETKYNLNLSALRSDGFNHLIINCDGDDSSLSCANTLTQ